VAADKDGDFIVTMEHPSITAPGPIVLEIGTNGVTYSDTTNSSGKLAAAVAAARGTAAPPAQRVGFGHHD
jgi:hypothetical protein